MRKIDLERAKEVVDYFNDNNSTVRDTAKACGISKSTVYNYVTRIFPNPTSEAILQKNKRERHIRGGLATRKKYEER